MAKHSSPQTSKPHSCSRIWRRARKGAAPGPTGLTSETLRLILDDEQTTESFIGVATKVAQAQIAAAISQAIGLGRMVALQKPNGRVRGIVVGDLLRRLVSDVWPKPMPATSRRAAPTSTYWPPGLEQNPLPIASQQPQSKTQPTQCSQ